MEMMYEWKRKEKKNEDKGRYYRGWKNEVDRITKLTTEKERKVKIALRKYLLR